MITIIKSNMYAGGNKTWRKMICLDADVSNLPTDLANGSILHIMDAANNPYYYDEDNDAWYDSTGTVKS